MKNFKNLTVCLLILIGLIFESSKCANILVWIPTPSISHQVIGFPIVKELSLRGHNVTFITANPLRDKSLTNLTEVDVSESYTMWTREMSKEFSKGSFGFLNHGMYLRVFTFFADVWDEQLHMPHVKEALFEKDYDVFLAESSNQHGLPYLRKILNCPVIQIGSLHPGHDGLYQIGDIMNPSHESSYILYFHKPRNFYEKVINTLFMIFDSLTFSYLLIPKFKDVFLNHFNNTPVDERDRTVDMILSNIHPVMNGARPDYPNVIGIGGILQKQPKRLPKDLQSFLDSATEGVIYFSLGSNVKSNLLAADRRQVFIEAFAKLPYKVLWKFESEELPGKPSNVMINKWLPQVDVLAHPNVKLFITQGGIQSLEESIHARIPSIGIPFFGDQFWNTDHMVNMGAGLALDLATLTSDKLVETVQKVIHDKTFKEKVTEMGDLLEDSPMKPLDKAVYWIEYVIRHKGAKVLQSPKLGMSWFEYLCIDVILFLLSVVLLVVLTSVYLAYSLYRILPKVTLRINKQKIN